MRLFSAIRNYANKPDNAVFYLYFAIIIWLGRLNMLPVTPAWTWETWDWSQFLLGLILYFALFLSLKFIQKRAEKKEKA